MFKKLIEGYKGKRIFRSMFVACFSLAAACIFLASILGFWWFYNTQIGKEKEDDGNILYASSLMINNYIDSVKNTMEVLQNDKYVQRQFIKGEFIWNQGMGIAAQEVINTVLVNPVFHSIYVLRDGDYVIKCSSPSYPMDANADRRMIEVFYQSNFGIYGTEYYTNPWGKEQSLLYLTDGEQNLSSGEKESGILISMDIEKVMESVFLTRQEGEEYWLMDKEGNVVYACGESYVNGKKMVEGDILTFILATELKQSEILRIDGQKYLLTCVRMDNGFYLTHSLPYSYIDAPINHMRNTFILIGILLVILLLLLAFGMSNWVYSPIEAVVKTAGQGEDLSERLGNTELASIARTYQTMVQTLNNLNVEKEQEELSRYLTSKSANKSLPEWVEETYGKKGIRFQMLCLRISDTQDLHKNNTEEAIAFEIQTITHVIVQVMKPLCEVLVNPIDKEYIAVVLFSDESLVEKDVVQKIREIFAISKELIEIGMDAGLSNEKSSFEELASMYSMARAATAYRFIYGINSVVTEDQMTKKALGSRREVDTHQLLRLLKDSDRQGFTLEYSRLIEEVKEFSIQSAREALADMAAEIQKYYNSLNHNFQALSGGDYESLNAELAKFEYIDDVQEWFFQMVDDIWLVLLRAKKSGREDVVDKTLDYLNENYADANISAQMIADMFRITPSYFSRLFNERSGQAFPDYLAGLRIEKAREMLLKEQNKSIQEICEMVGYTNPSYFTATFKKRFGITPGQYRKNHQ